MTPYDKIADNGTPQQVLELAVGASKFELESAANSVTDEQLVHLGQWTSVSLTTTGVQSVLWLGGLLLLYRLPTDSEGRTDLFEAMLEDLGVSKSKAYDAIRIFEVFGKLFFADQSLMRQFPVRALRHLAAEKATSAAREAAMEQARRGERITISLALSLTRQHAADDDEQDGAVPVLAKAAATNTSGGARGKRDKAATMPVWSYSGDVVNLTIEAAQATAHSDPQLIIQDWQAALDSFLQEHGLLKNHADQSDAA